VFKSLKKPTKLEGYVRLTALIKVKDITENTVRLSGWVDVFDNVVCSKRNMKRGEILTKDDIYLARKTFHACLKIYSPMQAGQLV